METIDEIFETLSANKDDDLDYSYHSDNDMDNIESMNKFLEENSLGDYISEYDGTMVFLKHPDYNFEAVVTSSGLGDFFSHGIYVAVAKR